MPFDGTWPPPRRPPRRARRRRWCLRIRRAARTLHALLVGTTLALWLVSVMGGLR